MTGQSRRRASRQRTRTTASGRLWVGWALTLAFEALVFQFQSHDERSGWFTHFFIGAGVALIAMTVWLVEERRPVPLPGLWLVAGHLLAVFPDLLFAAGIAHRHWMDAFLGHLISHSAPGGNLLWYAVFLGALALYLTVDVRTRAAQATGGRRRRRHA